MGASQLPGEKSRAFLKAGWTFLCDLSSKIALEEVVEGSRRVGGGYRTGKTSSQISSASAAVCYSIRERPIRWLPSHCLLATSRNSGLRAGEQKLGPMEPRVFSKCNSSPCRHGPVI